MNSFVHFMGFAFANIGNYLIVQVDLKTFVTQINLKIALLFYPKTKANCAQLFCSTLFVCIEPKLTGFSQCDGFH